MSASSSDVLVIFGITGDLAKIMTFGSLYRLEARGEIDWPIVGVAVSDWTMQDLSTHAREAIEGTGVAIDEMVFDRLIGRFTYVQGDFLDDATYQRVHQAIGGATSPTFYLEIPPSLFGPVVRRLAAAGLIDGGRVVVEKPFGHDLASARELNRELHGYVDENQLFRIDHFLGKLSVEDIGALRFANQVLEPIWNRNFVSSVQITMAESLGVADRGSFYDPVGALRDVVQNHLLQVLSLVAMEPPTAPGPDMLNDHKRDVFLSIPPIDPKHCVYGQYDGYRDVPGVAPDSTTETYCALRLELDSWRWSGVPFYIRTGKALRARATEVRLVFREPPRLGSRSRTTARPRSNQLVLRIDPDPGARLDLMAKAADGNGLRDVHLDMDFAAEGGAGPTPYEVLLMAAMAGDRTDFIREDSVEETWRIIQPLLDDPPEVVGYPQNSWGPKQADTLTAFHGGWREPWLG